MGEKYLNATIRYEDKEIDIRFSNNLDKTLSIHQNNWHLEVRGKLLRIEQHRALKEYPLGDGDVLEVIINE